MSLHARLPKKFTKTPARKARVARRPLFERRRRIVGSKATR
jgi:hypothetical protein